MELKDYQQLDPIFKEYVLTRLSALTDEEVIRYLPEPIIKEFMANWQEFWGKEKEMDEQSNEDERIAKDGQINWVPFKRENKTKSKSRLRISIESLGKNDFLKIGKDGVNQNSMYCIVSIVKKKQKKDFKIKKSKDGSGWVIARVK